MMDVQIQIPLLSTILNDSDEDGIIDQEDSCPSEPERYNDFEDDDGCPDIPPYTLWIKIQTKMEF